MKLEELKQQSQVKVLFRGQSARGKTRNSCKIVLELLGEGLDILYIDTESEGANTLVNLIEKEGYDDDIVENLTYQQVGDLEQLMEWLEKEGQYDVTVIDTLDHKHSFVLKAITDAKTEAGADWNEYAQIYSHEKEVMEDIGKPDSHIIATIDPDSGKIDKPKGAQTNVHGYFSIVVDLNKSGGEWGNKITNWVGRDEVIGVGADNLTEAITNEILERTDK